MNTDVNALIVFRSAVASALGLPEEARLHEILDRAVILGSPVRFYVGTETSPAGPLFRDVHLTAAEAFADGSDEVSGYELTRTLTGTCIAFFDGNEGERSRRASSGSVPRSGGPPPTASGS